MAKHRYILVHGAHNDDIGFSIENLPNKEEAIRYLNDMDNDMDYFGFSRINDLDYFKLIVSDDEKLTAKYRDALSYKEFMGAFYSKFAYSTSPGSYNMTDDFIDHFKLVWGGLLTCAYQSSKFYTYEDPETGSLFSSEGTYLEWTTVPPVKND